MSYRLLEDLELVKVTGGFAIIPVILAIVVAVVLFALASLKYYAKNCNSPDQACPFTVFFG